MAGQTRGRRDDRAWLWSGRGAILIGVLLAGCAGRSRAVPPAPVRAVEMDPVRVTARRVEAPSGEPGDTGSLTEVEIDAYDAHDLLSRGNAALAEGRYEDALAEYDRLVREFPESATRSAAHYNAALALERSGRMEQAAERYLTLVETLPRSRDVIDSLFQAARAYERLERWQRAAEVLGRLVEREELTPDQRVEALSRYGAALVEADHPDEGERQLRRAIAFARRLGVEALRTDYYLAQAQYYLGEIPRRAMQAIELTNVESQFRRALEARCELLLAAQTQYVQAIRVGNAHWGAASAYRVGQMYSGLYDDVMAVPVPEVEVPADLTHPEEIAAFQDEFPRHYRRLLREYLEPLLHNAIRWWESNLMMVERTGVGGPWAEDTRAQLARVQRLLDEVSSEGEDGGEAGVERDPGRSLERPEPIENTGD